MTKMWLKLISISSKRLRLKLNQKWLPKTTLLVSHCLGANHITKVTFRCKDINGTVVFNIPAVFKGSPAEKPSRLWFHWTVRQWAEMSRKKEMREERSEPFMSLIHVVQGHRAQCTLVDCSPRIHRSFLFPDMLQAALPWGAWQSMTSPLFVCAYVCVAKGPKPQPISTSCRLQTLRASCHPSQLPHFVNMLYDGGGKRKLHFRKVAVDTVECFCTNSFQRLNLILQLCGVSVTQGWLIIYCSDRQLNVFYCSAEVWGLWITGNTSYWKSAYRQNSVWYSFKVI